MIPPNCMPRRKKCAATTREALLEAAKGRFLADSYDNVGLREVAGDAGVDVALVSRYFGSKEELFKQVLRGRENNPFPTELPAEELPAFLIFALSQKEGERAREHMDRLLIMLRSASSSTASKIVREAFKNDVLEPLAKVIGGEDAKRKAALVTAVLIGSSFLKTVLTLEPVKGGDDRALFEAELLQLLRTALSPGDSAQEPAS